MPDKYTLTLDSTQLQAFTECPQMWQLAYREHLVHLGSEEKEAINAGTYGHSMLEAYYKGRASGFSLDDSLVQANSLANPSTLEHRPYALSDEMIFTVKGRVRDAIYHYRNNDILPNGCEAVEVGFSEPIFESDHNLFILEGKIDILGVLQGIPCIVDHKFQFRQRDLYKKCIQFRNYCMITGVDTLIVNYIRLTKKLDKSTLVRDVVSFTPAEQRWWRGRLVEYFWDVKNRLLAASVLNCANCGHEKISHVTGRYLTGCVKDDCNCIIFQPPAPVLYQERGACSGKFGYACSYTDLCEHTDPQLVQLIKARNYTTREEWRPW